MTPENKAKELVSKFTQYVADDYNDIEGPNEGIIHGNAKNCAAISVDEILSAITFVDDSKYAISQKLFWKEVKHEIKSL